MIWLLAIAAVLCNVAAQVSIKLANQSSQSQANDLGGWVAPWLTPWIISALILYAASFVLTVRIFSTLPLSEGAPAMAGATFFLVALASYLFLGESLSYEQLLGMTLIVLGIYFLVTG